MFSASRTAAVTVTRSALAQSGSGPSSRLHRVAVAATTTSSADRPTLCASFHSTPRTYAAPRQGGGGGGGPARPPARPDLSRKIKVNPLTLRNGDIPFQVVQLVEEESKTVGEPTELSLLLRQFDHDTHMLKLVSEDPPVVKIVNIEEDKRKEREHEARIKLSKRLSVEDKELQVGWHGAPSDLQHKVQTARNIIEKGDRVHVVFANRVSGGKRPKPVADSRKAEIIRMFEQGLGDIASKWKEDDNSKGLWISYWQPQSAIASEVRQKVVESLVDGKRKKEEAKEARRLKEEERARKARERQAAMQAKASGILGKI